MTPSPLPTPPGDRLERALAAYLSAPPSTRGEADELLAGNPDLAELLQPMLGDFRLVRELGRGGMGIVHEAWQRSLDRRVAVKVLSPALVANPAAAARFRREAAAAGRLRHPHIVEVFGFGSVAGEHFFAMQFVDGRPLHDVAERFREPEAAVALAAQLADALHHAHAAGLVHRDVKPGNVLVRADGSVLLTDFGVARDEALPSLTRDGSFVGTLDYASPEQVRGEVVDARSDVWALGVILHELLAGSHPFTASTQQATLHRILTAEPPRLQGRPGITDDLAAVVDRALAKNRLHRYASAAALLADLHALQRGEGVSVRLPTGVERVRRWAAREPWRAFAAAVVLVAAPVLTGVLGYLWANAGRIEAATAAEAFAQREEIVSAALLAMSGDNDAQRVLTALEPLAGGDEEMAIVRALLLTLILGRPADAHAALQGFSGPVVELMHRFIDQPRVVIERLDAVPAPPTALRSRSTPTTPPRGQTSAPCCARRSRHPRRSRRCRTPCDSGRTTPATRTCWRWRCATAVTSPARSACSSARWTWSPTTTPLRSTSATCCHAAAITKAHSPRFGRRSPRIRRTRAPSPTSATRWGAWAATTKRCRLRCEPASWRPAT